MGQTAQFVKGQDVCQFWSREIVSTETARWGDRVSRIGGRDSAHRHAAFPIRDSRSPHLPVFVETTSVGLRPYASVRAGTREQPDVRTT